MQRIAASGGDAVGIPGVVGRFPCFLPDGVHFLFHGYAGGGAAGTRGIFLSSTEGTEPRRLLDGDTAAIYASGHLLFVRGNTLLAQSFDVDTLTLSGSAFPVAGGMIVNSTLVAAPLSGSTSGPLVFRAGTAGGLRRFVWLDRSGRELGQVGDFVVISLSPSLSLDGKRIAFHQTVNGSIGIWLLETQRGVLDRLTDESSNEFDPTWSPDGTRIAYSAPGGIFERSIAGGEPRRILDSSAPVIPSDWSRDGRWLLYDTVPD